MPWPKEYTLPGLDYRTTNAEPHISGQISLSFTTASTATYVKGRQ